jgi:hypothetical protein
MNNQNKIGLITLLAGCLASNLVAGTLTNYTAGDVLLCFRNGGARNLVVNAGPLTTLTNLTANQRYTISTFTGTQLGQVATNAVSWSAFTWLSDDSLFVTRARTALETQATPWRSASGGSQHNTALRMATIPVGAKENFGSGLNSSFSTSTAVIEDDLSAGNPNYLNGLSYRDAYVGSYGANFSGTFAGNPENTTLADFTTSGKVVRSDFYQLPPTANVLGKWLGYFELNTNGVITYVAYPSSTPVIKSISHVGNLTSIDYTAGLYGTYTLRGTNSAGLSAARSSWPVIATLTSGDTAVHTATDTTTDDNKFYIITAQ